MVAEDTRMTRWVALLRAVNVGGTGKLSMAELKTMCETAGFTDVRTYIASCNVVFGATGSERHVQQELGARLEAHTGKAGGLLVRSAAEMAAVVTDDAFPEAPRNRVIVVFLDEPPTAADLDGVSNQTDERLALGRREIYVHYPNGMGDSKLKLPAAARGTGRNMNTVAKLAEMAATS
jgi:uncharacterized protein (DUF1697 family)